MSPVRDYMGIDEKDVLDAAVQFQIKNGDRFLGKPVIGVEVDNSTPCHLIQSYLREALLECFPMTRGKKEKYMTGSVSQSICEGGFVQEIV